MSTMVIDSAHHTSRQVRGLLRQPWYIAITLAQPILWLVLFGALFRRVVDLPGFGSTSYITYLTPGIVVMTALFSSGWHGAGLLLDMERGTLDRFLVTPVRRVALIVGPLIQNAIVTLIQSIIIITLAWAMGAHYPGGILGIAVFLVAAVVLGSGLAALSNVIALTTRRQESLIAASTFITLPLTFLTTAFMPANLVPSWIATVARYNPVNWAIDVGRGAMAPHPSWGGIMAHIGYLACFAAVLTWLAMVVFRSYQRSA
jgi:ABC-2 type transport system permease protein